MNTMLNGTDFGALSPLLLLLVLSLLLLLWESFDPKGSKKYALFLTVTGFLATLVAAYIAPISENPLLTPWIRFDALSNFFTFFFLLIGLSAALLSAPLFQRWDVSCGEYYFLLTACVFGLLLIGYAADFLTLFLGLETLSISLYILCGYIKKWEISNESSIKYFLMGALATAFLLYGIALIYGAVGTTRFDLLLTSYKATVGTSFQPLFLSGIALVTLGLGFKAAIVPFHTWAPDVYEGASTPVTAFMAVGTKAGAFAAFAILFLVSLPHFDPLWNQGIALLAYPTLIYANLLALRQTQMRRFFAYSGISHAGFLLIPLAAGTGDSLYALLFYLIIYAFATLGAFAVLAMLDQKEEGVMLEDLIGLYKRAPFLAALFSLCLLTLAGIPPTVGFFAKFYVLKVAFQAGYFGLVIVGLLMAIFSAYYYLRIVSFMFSEAPKKEALLIPSSPAVAVGLIAFAAILILSCYPAIIHP